MSNLFDTIGICPYTGLRSFTEEESLYFKGRDAQVDQLTALLEQNRFLMVTGASGEGKSSLTYAGLIPNARAGFFKAKYTNWVVADFRPERNPVTNMAQAMAEKLNSKPATVETELRRGFSSLIDLYTNSEFYTNEEDEQWKQLTETEKKDKRRKSANLLILVDQFEEFSPFRKICLYILYVPCVPIISGNVLRLEAYPNTLVFRSSLFRA
jgi:energy-coupling factor transporter ATP-binding protein EcfA2